MNYLVPARTVLPCLALLTLLVFGFVSASAQSDNLLVYELGRAQITDPALNNLEISVTLQGVIALPEAATPAPLVVILHGRHAMCGGDIFTYPCESGEEVRYDLGFSYLVEALAEAGFAAIAININAGLTEAYGRGDDDTRTRQIVDAHLAALRDAAAGISTAFPLLLENRIDFERIAFIGHSSGGGAALSITRTRAERSEAEDIDALLLIAAAYNPLGPEGVERTGDELYTYYSVPSDVPVATILPDCDGDQIRFYSQIAYEAAHLDPSRTAFAGSVRLFSANHNHFNANVERGDRRFGYPPCFGETTYIMPRSEQEGFLTQYAVDFLETVWGDASETFDVTIPPPDTLYGLPVQTNLSLPTAQRHVLYASQQTDGQVFRTIGDAGVMYCVSGENCLGGITTAGRFGFARLAWAQRGAFEVIMPGGELDFTPFAWLHVRAVPDYTSNLNTIGSQLRFALTLQDAEGSTSTFIIENKSSLEVPAPAEFYAYRPFILYPASIRIPLTAFSDIDLTRVSRVRIQAYESSGTLLLADIELLQEQ